MTNYILQIDWVATRKSISSLDCLSNEMKCNFSSSIYYLIAYSCLPFSWQTVDQKEINMFKLIEKKHTNKKKRNRMNSIYVKMKKKRNDFEKKLRQVYGSNSMSSNPDMRLASVSRKNASFSFDEIVFLQSSITLWTVRAINFNVVYKMIPIINR